MIEYINIQDQIKNKYKEYELPVKNFTIKEICKNKDNSINLTLYQKFLKEYSLEIKHKGILLYHSLGSGKSLTSILMAQNIINKGKAKGAIILAPASLRLNYKSELKKLPNETNDLFEIHAYNTRNSLKDMPDLKDKIVVIDEIQNLVSMVKNQSKNGIAIYKELLNSNCKIICLSATPVMNVPYEYAILFNLLKPKSFKFNNFDFIYEYIDINSFEIKNKDKFHDKIKGLVSYYNGINENTEVYPKSKTIIEKLVMSPLQEKFYYENNKKESKKQIEVNNMALGLYGKEDRVDSVYFINSRLSCNSIITSKITPKIMENLKDYSVKYARILELVKESKGPVMIYSNFVDKGILEMEQILNHSKIKNLKWIGGQTDKVRKEMLEEFNDSKNKNKNIVFLVSKAGAEGLSLKNVRQIHIIEPHWNVVKTRQIIGRGIRLCSHSDLHIKEHFVNIYMYIAKFSNIKKVSADQVVYEIAQKKIKVIDSLEKIIQSSAIDCKLNRKQNTGVEFCFNDIN